MGTFGDCFTYRGSPTYAKITNVVPYFCGFGLCMLKWGDFHVIRGPLTVLLTQILSNAVFLKSRNPCNAGTLCMYTFNLKVFMDQMTSFEVLCKFHCLNLSKKCFRLRRALSKCLSERMNWIISRIPHRISKILV